MLPPSKSLYWNMKDRQGDLSVQGLELSEEYYQTYGVRMIEEKFADYKDRIAVGLVGEGSECYGFDDQISRDHDWGPGFCLWLTADDYRTIGQELQKEYERLPQTYKGFKRFSTQWGGGRIGVHEIGAFYQRSIGSPHAPDTIERWLYIPEEYLSSCTNGKVFTDPLGEFTKIRNELLKFYPEDIRLLKIAWRCMTCAQAGQYNFMRSVRRHQFFAALYAETKFCSDMMSLVFLLNRRYAPFYKWRHLAVRSLPVLGKFLYEQIDSMMATVDYQKKNEIIEEICARVIREFHRQGLSRSTSDFLLDHSPIIQDNIKDDKLRKRAMWRE